MGIKERKARGQSDLKRKIMAAAEELFVQEGYANVSMRKIAEKIEYSPTTIYRYFKNKAEVMNQLIADGYRGVRLGYENTVSHRAGSPLETFKEVVRNYVDYALTHPNHYGLWFSSGQLTLEEGKPVMQHGDLRFNVFSVWLSLIRECQERGLLAGEAPLPVFQLVWGSVHGLISLRLHNRSFPWPPLPEQLEGLLGMVENGLRPACRTPDHQNTETPKDPAEG